jgi:ABC-type Mn2+/Zn2+ transport system permease subunit
MIQLFSSIQEFFQYDFLLYALLGTLFISITCGLISPLIIARKNAFMGAAISHSTLLGLAISLSLFSAAESLSVFLCTLILTLLLTLFLAYSTFRQKLPNDSLIGIFYTSTMALGIIVHSLFAKDKGDLMSFLFGNVLLLTKEDLILSFLLMILTILVILIPLKRWLFITFDEESAITSGIKVSLYHYSFFIMLAFLIVASIKLAGTILVETLLLVPGFFALSFAKSSKQAFLISTLFSLVFAVAGIIIANAFGLPSGATLAVVLFLALVLALLFKKVYNQFK